MAFVVALKLSRGKREREKMHILQIYILVFPVASRAAFFFSMNEEIPEYEIQLHPNNKPVDDTTGSVFHKAKLLNRAKYLPSFEEGWKRKWPSIEEENDLLHHHRHDVHHQIVIMSVFLKARWEWLVFLQIMQLRAAVPMQTFWSFC